MNEAQTLSWIFYATALATQVSPAKPADISGVADAINHAVPNHKELIGSLQWLSKVGLVKKEGRSYSLTEYGLTLLNRVEKKRAPLLKTWERLEKLVEEMLKEGRT